MTMTAMKTKARTRRYRGRRSRKSVVREPNGRPSRAERKKTEGPVIPAEVIERRAELVGIEHATDELAGTALGRLRLRGLINERQHDAGRKYAALVARWSRLAECPDRHAKVVRLPVASDVLVLSEQAPQVIDWLEDARAADVDGQWSRAKRRLGEIHQAVRRLPQSALAAALLEGVCIDDTEPRDGPWLDKCLPPLRQVLSLLADHYRLAPELELA